MKASEEGKAVKAIIANVPGVQAVYLEELVLGWASKGLPAALVRRAGGTRDDTDARPRYAIEVYARGGTAAVDAMQDICNALQWAPYSTSFHLTPFGLLDDIEVDSLPTQVPYPDDTIREYVAFIRITRRD